MKEIFGTIKSVRIPRDSKSGLSLMKELEAFAAKLKVGHIVAMPNTQPVLEGPYWLALLVEGPRVATRREVLNGENFETGSLVIKVRWYKYRPEFCKVLEKGGPMRAYKLEGDEMCIPVNPVLRVFGLKFHVGSAGEGGQRTLRSGMDAVQLLPEDTDNAIKNCLTDQGNNQ